MDAGPQTRNAERVIHDNGSGDEARPMLPQLRLDDLLAELQARLEAARGTRDRIHALLEAVVSIGSELDLETVLHRIVEAATTLVDARYGALGVIGEEGERLVEFITVGVPDRQIEEIGHWPHGHGILGLLIKEPHALRLTDLTRHPESYGFPPGHPAMRTFLGVPIRVRDEVFGNLYLTEKTGGAQFDEEDESVVVALATAAGVAIENARLYEETRRRERWLEASAEISTALLSGTDPHEVTALVARRAREIADADLATVWLTDELGGELRMEAAAGAHGDGLRGLRVPLDDGTAEQVPARVFRTGATLRLEECGAAPWSIELPAELRDGAVLAVPLGHGASARGCSSCSTRRCRRRSTPPPSGCWRRSRGRPRWRWSWPGGAATPSAWPCWRTATASPGTCTTPSSSGCSPRP
ncbi:GAF domain-containing protein [Actinomadura keratinilytica]|uniref:GAF domain-containing protein n=1 Tax=Actinomadura keratinilytica TaxID=547461 RepID=UPI003615B673